MKPSDFIKKGWTQKGGYAADKNGNYVGTRSSIAVEWCIEGALFAVYDYEEYKQVVKKIRKKHGPNLPNLATWNDAPERTQEQVIALLESVGE